MAEEIERYITHREKPYRHEKTSTASLRQVKRASRAGRWGHDRVLEDVQRRLDENPTAMTTRRDTVEHPFGRKRISEGFSGLESRVGRIREPFASLPRL